MAPNGQGPRPDKSVATNGNGSGAGKTEQREFWETWADEKSARTPAPAAAAPKADAKSDVKIEAKTEAPAKVEAKSDAKEAPAKGGRRGKKDDDAKTETKGEAKTESKGKASAKTKGKADKAEKPETGKRASAAPEPAGDPSEQVKLYVSLGKSQGVSAPDLRTLLGAKLGGDQGKIGSIMLRDTHAYVKVPGDIAAKIIATVHGTKHDGAAITVERAKA